MAEGSFVAYYRVSTDRQGRSGLGLDAQRNAVANYLNGGAWTLAAEFTEVESGKNADRPQLAAALKACRIYGARLVIAKLDRLSRDVHFLTGLQKAGVRFVAADMPDATEMTVQIMAVVAEAERKMISRRTKEALAAAKARGTVLGGLRETKLPGKLSMPERIARLKAAAPVSVASRRKAAEARTADLAPVVAELRAAGVTSLPALAKALTERGIPTARGMATWSPMQVSRVLERLT
jgi:DNA invertase Pin-like site-specific DNA recombinase